MHGGPAVRSALQPSKCNASARTRACLAACAHGAVAVQLLAGCALRAMYTSQAAGAEGMPLQAPHLSCKALKGARSAAQTCLQARPVRILHCTLDGEAAHACSTCLRMLQACNGMDVEEKSVPSLSATGSHGDHSKTCKVCLLKPRLFASSWCFVALALGLCAGRAPLFWHLPNCLLSGLLCSICAAGGARRVKQCSHCRFHRGQHCTLCHRVNRLLSTHAHQCLLCS